VAEASAGGPTPFGFLRTEFPQYMPASNPQYPSMPMLRELMAGRGGDSWATRLAIWVLCLLASVHLRASLLPVCLEYFVTPASGF